MTRIEWWRRFSGDREWLLSAENLGYSTGSQPGWLPIKPTERERRGIGREVWKAVPEQRSIFDASPSALGYYYQCRLALLFALRRDDDPSLTISIEKLDDISFQKEGTPVELLQTKHHISRRGNLSDGSRDIWKTIRVWCEAVAKEGIDLDRAILCLVTTSVAAETHALRHLRPDQNVRDEIAAQTALEESGRASTDTVVQDAFQSYWRLRPEDRHRLFRAIHLLDGAESVEGLEVEISREIRRAADPKHLQALVARLEGWWFQQVIRHLRTSGNSPIPVSDVTRQVSDLREQFKPDSLPDDLLHEEVPAAATPDDDDRLFVRQLFLIGLTSGRVRGAQQDHYRAFTQRSRWIKGDLIDVEELSRYETRLKDNWNVLFQIMVDEVVDGCADEELKKLGLRMFNWAQTEAPKDASLFVRPQFQSAYMTRGSYHMLADCEPPCVGWHPHYVELLGLVGQPVGGTAL